MPQKAFTYFIKVFGCQMNYADAERITATLKNNGGRKTENQKAADLIVTVSCGVRQSAEERIISWIKRAKNTNPRAVIALAGCLGHREDLKKRLRDSVDHFVPAGKKIPANLINSAYPVHSVHPVYSSSYRAYLPVTTGCDNFCSYCVVPYARGREKSLAPEIIIGEAKRLIRKGYKELFLLGQNVNSYQGIDREGKPWTFSQILRAVNAIPGHFWIKFISSHPKDVNQKLILAIKECRKVSRNLHLPLQSGSDKVLRAMNRKYRQRDYLATVARIKKIIPEIVFSTDIIVGFPGETAADFRGSLKVVRKVGFEMLYALKYSPRPETVAYQLKDDVSAQTKKERQQILDKTWKAIALRKNQRFLNKRITFLIDKIKTKSHPKGQKIYWAIGKNFEQKDVAAQSPKPLGKAVIGQLTAALITQANPLCLQGKFLGVKKKL